MSVVEMVHARRMKREGEVAEENKCSGLKQACEKDEGRKGRTMSVVERVHARRMREGEGRTMSAAERVHVRRMRAEDKCLQQRGCM